MRVEQRPERILIATTDVHLPHVATILVLMNGKPVFRVIPLALSAAVFVQRVTSKNSALLILDMSANNLVEILLRYKSERKCS
jgi:hypothetical protein